MIGKLFKIIFNLNSRKRKIFLILCDLSLLILSLIIAYFLYSPENYLINLQNNLLLIPLVSIIGIPLFIIVVSICLFV